MKGGGTRSDIFKESSSILYGTKKHKTRPFGREAKGNAWMVFQEPGLPVLEGEYERGKGGWSGFTRTVLPLRDSAGLPIQKQGTGFPHCAPRVRAAGAPLPGV